MGEKKRMVKEGGVRGLRVEEEEGGEEEEEERELRRW